jgi:hypothetical protein
MAEGLTGLVDLKKDGTIGLTIAGQRHKLRQITLGELRRFRDLYNDAQAEVTDYDELDARPALVDLQNKVKAAKTRDTRAKHRKTLNDLNDKRDRFVQAQWAGWWREVIATLSDKKLPDPDTDDPADGLEPWMVDSPRAIPTLFGHWRAVPLAESSGGTEAMMRTLSELAANG